MTSRPGRGFRRFFWVSPAASSRSPRARADGAPNCRLQAIAVAIGKCPAEERGGLVELFRKHQEGLQIKTKDIRSAMESLTQRLKPPDLAGGA